VADVWAINEDFVVLFAKEDVVLLHRFCQPGRTLQL
jgi:hypothetical protein